MPTPAKLVVHFAATLLTVGFAALFGIVGMTVWLNEQAQVYSDGAVVARETRFSAVELRDALRTAESSQRGFLVTGNEIYLAPYDSAKVAAQVTLGKIAQQLVSSAESLPMLRRLENLIDGKIAEMDSIIALKKDRNDEAALTSFRTNRGKALMDEINVFLYSIILSADERVAVGIAEQRTNAALLRWVSIVGALIVIAVVGGVIIIVMRYASETGRARDEVRALNFELEDRVQRRTVDLAQARERAEILLYEVNHRVANSLMLVASLVKLQSNALADHAAKEALSKTEGRIFAIASVHKWLYGSGDARSVALDEYLSSLLDQLENSMRAEGHGASLQYDLKPLTLPTDLSVNLGVVTAELVTNAFKYAYPNRNGQVRVRLADRNDGSAELVVEDDGVGRDTRPVTIGTGLGTRIVNAMAASMSAEVTYISRNPGTAARIVFPYVPDAA